MKVTKVVVGLFVVVFLQSIVSAENKDIFSVLSEKSFMQKVMKSWKVERDNNYGDCLNFSFEGEKKAEKEGDNVEVVIQFQEQKTVKGVDDIFDLVKYYVKRVGKSASVNKDFKSAYPVQNGVGGTVVDFNKQKVGFIEYEVKLNDEWVFCRHCLLMKEKRVYMFSMAFRDTVHDREQLELLNILAARAINSGKL